MSRQFVTFNDIKKYPLLYEKAKEYLEFEYQDYNQVDVDNIKIATAMKPWVNHEYGREFWRLISLGDFTTVISKFKKLKYLFKEQSELTVQTINNGLWV